MRNSLLAKACGDPIALVSERGLGSLYLEIVDLKGGDYLIFMEILTTKIKSRELLDYLP